MAVSCMWDTFFSLGCLLWPQWEQMSLVSQDLKCQDEWDLQGDPTNSEEKGREDRGGTVWGRQVRGSNWDVN